MAKLTVACVGDVMCGDQFNQIGWGTASKIEQYGKDFVDPRIVAILKSHDIVLANVECVLSDCERDIKQARSLHMRGRPESAVRIKEWGINAVNLANNHILEHGSLPAEDTVNNLKKNGIIVTGIDDNGKFNNSPSWTEMIINGQTIAIYGFCLRDEKYAYYYREDILSLCRQIQQRRKSGDIVIISVHWGDELIDRPSLQQRNVADQLLDAGATLVAGHHPHVVQGLRKREGCLVAYSLGNFIFDSWCNHTSWSIVLSLQIDNQKIINYRTIPIVRSRDYRPVLAEDEIYEKLVREIDRRNQLVQDVLVDGSSYQRVYDSEVRRLNCQDRIQLWLRIAMFFWKVSPRYWRGIFARPILRRLGKW
ncbi:MAG: Capsule biosynthesis protein CapA [Pelotomaculum sp. PtaB.Bin104]|nr:MAG: Capsule biosynthesis protein CapA [Pelotomaculum sp. PtaB.Bin104]